MSSGSKDVKCLRASCLFAFFLVMHAWKTPPQSPCVPEIPGPPACGTEEDAAKKQGCCRDLLARTPSSLTDVVAAPASLSSLACLAIEVGPGEWEVPMGEPLLAFLCSSGPPSIVRYNLQFVCRNVDRKLVVRASSESSGAHSAADVYSLTHAGAQRLLISEVQI